MSNDFELNIDKVKNDLETRSKDEVMEEFEEEKHTGYVYCPVCNEVIKGQGRYAHFIRKHPEENYEEYKDKFSVAPVPVSHEDTELDELIGAGEEGAPPIPVEIETVHEAIKFIGERLPQVFGIGNKNIKVILRALKDDPTPLRDGNLLHTFIKSLAPKAYDSHLTISLIRPLYMKFPNLAYAVDAYISTFRVPTQGTQYNQRGVGLGFGYYPPNQIPYTPYSYPYHNPYNPYVCPYPYSPQPYPQPPMPGTPTPPPKPPKQYKIVVEGQEIETDEAGYRAWLQYKKEMEAEKRRAKKDELEIG